MLTDNNLEDQFKQGKLKHCIRLTILQVDEMSQRQFMHLMHVVVCPFMPYFGLFSLITSSIMERHELSTDA